MEREELIEALRLEPLSDEGGWFRRNFGDDHSSAIYFLLEAGRPTMLHRLPGAEVFHFYSGDPAKLVILGASAGDERGGHGAEGLTGGELIEPVLGLDLAAGQRPQIAVPGGTWQAAETLGEWTLLGTTMAPGFAWEHFELGERDRLTSGWPEHAGLIGRHTPEPAGD